MLHMVGHTFLAAQSAALQLMAAISDGIVITRDSALVCPSKPAVLNKIIAAEMFGANMLRAQLQVPSIRRYGNYEIKPIANAHAAGGAQTPILDLRTDPILLEVGEECPVYITQNNAGTQQEFGGILLADELKPIDTPKCESLRATGTTTLVAAAWTQVPLTFDTALPANGFTVIGARCEGASPILFRFVNQESVFRPGGFGNTGPLALDFPGQRRGGWGRWFHFDYTNPPTLEVLASAADTAQTLLLDVIPD